MNRKMWLYVVALRYAGYDRSDLGFKHAFVYAPNEDEAYRAGFAEVPVEAHEERVNDYVIDLGEFL